MDIIMAINHDKNESPERKISSLSDDSLTPLSRTIGGVGKRGREKQELILKVKAVCAQYREAMMLDGTVKEITGIFWQKCFDGFRDNDPLTDYAASQLPGEIDADAIMEKYKDLPED